MVLCYLLEWPDWALPDRFFWGFPIGGLVPPSNVLKQEGKTSKDEATLWEALGPAADAWNTQLASDTRVHDTDREIFETTRKEQNIKKILSVDYTKSELDSMFGVGGWRATRRRCIWQEGKGKYRNIDNAKKSGLNDMLALSDTILTVPHDIAIIIVQRLRSALNLPLQNEWQVGLSAEDQKSAYHTIPNLFSMLGLSVIA